MIQVENPYVDPKGRVREGLKRIYSDQGLRLLQVDTCTVYGQSVIDLVHVHHEYVEIQEDKGEDPVLEAAPEEDDGEISQEEIPQDIVEIPDEAEPEVVDIPEA